MASGWRLATRAAHAGTGGAAPGAPAPVLGPAGESAHNVPVYLTSNFAYPDSASADRAAEGEAYLYSRHGNPTTAAFERAVADLEGGDAGVAFGSGMAAVAAATFALGAGGEVLLSEGLYGGSTQLLRELGPRFGITPRFVKGWDTEAVRAALTPAVRALHVETISNPLLRVADLPALGALARERGVPLIVDSTFATPCLARPLEHGASVVVHSVSKYIGGHGDLIGGIAVGAADVMARLGHHRNLTGGVMDPFTAWLALRGLRTMPLRMERQCTTAARLAQVFAELPRVTRVHYPGLPAHPDHARARAVLAAPGAMVSFEVADGAAARRFYDRVQVIARAASLGEVASLLTHPASFSHKGLTAQERARSGIADGLLRLSVGIEDVADLEADVRQALSP